jgi:hypothetical protein
MNALVGFIGFPDEDLDGGGVVGVAGIIELRAVGDDEKSVHLGTEFDVFACVGDAVGEGELAGWSHGHVHEEVDVGGEVALVEFVAGLCGPVHRAFEEGLTAGVHGALLDGVANHVALAGAGASEGVVASAGIGNDGEEDVAFGGDDFCAGGEVDVLLLADGVLGAVAVSVVVGIVEESVDCLVAFEIDDANILAGANLVEEGVAGVDCGGNDGVFRQAQAGLDDFFWHGDEAPGRLEEVAFGQRKAAGIFGAEGAADVVGAWCFDFLEGEFDGPLCVDRVWIHGVLAGVEDDEGVHLGSKFDGAAGFGVVGNEVHAAVVVDFNFGEEVDVHHEVAAVEPVLFQLDEKAVEGVLVPFVASLLVSGYAIPFVDEGAVGTAAEGVVPTERVVGDGAQDAGHVGVEDSAGGEAGNVLCLEGIGEVEALGEVVGVEQKGADVAVVLKSFKTQSGSAFENVRPGRRSRESFLP